MEEPHTTPLKKNPNYPYKLCILTFSQNHFIVNQSLCSHKREKEEEGKENNFSRGFFSQAPSLLKHIVYALLASF